MMGTDLLIGAFFKAIPQTAIWLASSVMAFETALKNVLS